ncbi:hypothetical protein V1279_002756 [Bradyrhizobium sp. AZCC 1610]|uniref:hypothetical protein n=1 Tax=Bradyrhizobium sp. AZCC 1610 TaxID=3117020 RepID=UPI002FF3F2F6
MKWMILIVALISASEAKAQGTDNPSRQPGSGKVITTKDDGQNKGSTDPVHQGVRPPPSPSVTYTLTPAKGKKKAD